jgi:UDP-glucose 4-epimerase
MRKGKAMNVLVIGGAGYIGSMTARVLNENGLNVVVYDNLSRGHRQAVTPGIRFVRGELADTDLLHRVMVSRNIDAVMQFAAFIEVGESVANPLKYYDNNVALSIGLLESMRRAGVRHIIFSSTAAVYGAPENVPIPESHPIRPASPYGASKAMVERVLADMARAGDIDYVALRYFNAAGAHPRADMGEDHTPESHLIPLILKSLLPGQGAPAPLKVFGSDYDTPDGTCIRDYIHVHDLATAHLAALTHLSEGGESGAYNLGNGRGFSVLETIRTAERVTGKRVAFDLADRRAGDVAVLTAAAHRIHADLGWQPRYPDLETIIGSAWEWHRRHPNGYTD